MGDDILNEQEEELELSTEEEPSPIEDSVEDPVEDPVEEKKAPKTVSGLWTYECECGREFNCPTGQPKELACSCGRIHDFTAPKRTRKK